MKKQLVAVCFLLLLVPVTGFVIAENISATSTPQGKTTDLNPLPKVIDLDLTDLLDADNRSREEQSSGDWTEIQNKTGPNSGVWAWDEKQQEDEQDYESFDDNNACRYNWHGQPLLPGEGRFFDSEKKTR